MFQAEPSFVELRSRHEGQHQKERTNNNFHHVDFLRQVRFGAKFTAKAFGVASLSPLNGAAKGILVRSFREVEVLDSACIQHKPGNMSDAGIAGKPHRPDLPCENISHGRPQCIGLVLQAQQAQLVSAASNTVGFPPPMR